MDNNYVSKIKEYQIKTAGHLYLIINIVLPPAHSEQEQQAYQQFAEAFSTFRPRAS